MIDVPADSIIIKGNDLYNGGQMENDNQEIQVLVKYISRNFSKWFQ